MGIFNRSNPQAKTVPLVASAYNAPRHSITASASRVQIKNPNDLARMRNLDSQHVWQQYAWEYFDLIGQIHFGATIVASLTSRIKIFPAYIEDETSVPDHVTRSEVSDELKQHARDAISLLSDAPGGITGMMRTAALNTFVAGEFYLIKYKATAFSGEYWKVHSRDEIVVENNNVFVIPYPKAPKTDYVPVDGKFMARIWNPHPRFSEVSDSSMRSILDDCEEYTIIGRTVRATGRTKLNSGFLLIPDDLSASIPDDGETYESTDDPDVLAPYSESVSDSLEDDILNQIIEPTTDDGSPASVAPLLIRGPIDSLKGISHLTITRDFDKQQIELYNAALERILTGIDLPKDLISGLADLKYNNSVNVEESLYKNHIEPLAMFICDGLTSSFLKPVLRAWGHSEEEIRHIALWYDASSITAKPDKSASADFGYTNGLLNAEAWRRSHDFQETDAPTPEELVKKTVMAMPPNEQIMSAVLSELLPQYVAAAQAAYEEESPDTPSNIINSLEESDTSGQDQDQDQEPEEDKPDSFDDLLK